MAPGLVIFDGDWESGGFDSNFPGKFGFFLFPPLKAGGKQGAMSAPLTYGIAATAKHANCAAFFLNWVETNTAARALNVAVGGSNPGGPASLPIPLVKPGTVTAQTLAAGQVIAKDNGGMGFIANATGPIDRGSLDARCPGAFRRALDTRRRAEERAGRLRARAQCALALTGYE